MAEVDRLPTCNVLVVEDEWLIADHLQALVEGCGFGVIGPVPTVRDALELLEISHPDAALLDVTLGREKSYAIAAALKDRGVPFVLLTGYTRIDLPDDLGQAGLLTKPITDSEVCKTLNDVLGKVPMFDREA